MKRIDLESADQQARRFSALFVSEVDRLLERGGILPLLMEQKAVAQVECGHAMLGLFAHIAELVADGWDLSDLRREFNAAPEEGHDEQDETTTGRSGDWSEEGAS